MNIDFNKNNLNINEKVEKAISNINKLPKNKLEEACALLDYVYFGNFLYFGFINGCIKQKDFELFWKTITNFYGMSKQEYKKSISIYHKILDRMGITNEIYQKYSKKVMPTWKLKRLEEYVNIQNEISDTKLTIQNFFDEKEKRIEFDINLADHCLPIHETFTDNQYFCEMQIQDDGIISLDILKDWHEKKFGKASNKKVFSWFISTKSPHFQDKVHYYQKRNTFIIIIGTLDKKLIISDAVGERLKDRLNKNNEAFGLIEFYGKKDINDLMKDYLKYERFIVYSDNVEYLKEIGYTIFEGYDKISKDYYKPL